MADYYRQQGEGVPDTMVTKYADHGTYHALVVNVCTEWDSGGLQTLSDETNNDSDKSFNVPAGRQYQILWIWIEGYTTATVGDRLWCITFYDDSNDIIGEVRVGAVQAASETRYFMVAPALADLTDFRDTNYLMTPLPPTMILAPNYRIRVWDCNAVDAAADDMHVRIHVAWRPN